MKPVDALCSPKSTSGAVPVPHAAPGLTAGWGSCSPQLPLCYYADRQRERGYLRPQPCFGGATPSLASLPKWSYDSSGHCLGWGDRCFCPSCPLGHRGSWQSREKASPTLPRGSCFAWPYSIPSPLHGLHPSGQSGKDARRVPYPRVFPLLPMDPDPRVRLPLCGGLRRGLQENGAARGGLSPRASPGRRPGLGPSLAQLQAALQMIKQTINLNPTGSRSLPSLSARGIGRTPLGEALTH